VAAVEIDDPPAAGVQVHALGGVGLDGQLAVDLQEVPGFGGLALAYSTRFNRVYLAVDRAP
jgi:hypothetical protein